MIDRDRPTAPGTLLAASVATGAAVVLASTATTAGTVGLVGAGLLAVGGLLANRDVLDLGAALLLGGVLVAGIQRAAPPTVTVAAAGTVVAWDVAEHGVGLAEQLGPDAVVRRSVLIHATVSALVGGGTVAVGLGVYSLVGGAQPVVALGLLALAVVVLVAALRA